MLTADHQCQLDPHSCSFHQVSGATQLSMACYRAVACIFFSLLAISRWVQVPGIVQRIRAHALRDLGVC